VTDHSMPAPQRRFAVAGRSRDLSSARRCKADSDRAPPQTGSTAIAVKQAPRGARRRRSQAVPCQTKIGRSSGRNSCAVRKAGCRRHAAQPIGGRDARVEGVLLRMGRHRFRCRRRLTAPMRTTSTSSLVVGLLGSARGGGMRGAYAFVHSAGIFCHSTRRVVAWPATAEPSADSCRGACWKLARIACRSSCGGGGPIRMCFATVARKTKSRSVAGRRGRRWGGWGGEWLSRGGERGRKSPRSGPPASRIALRRREREPQI